MFAGAINNMSRKALQHCKLLLLVASTALVYCAAATGEVRAAASGLEEASRSQKGLVAASRRDGAPAGRVSTTSPIAISNSMAGRGAVHSSDKMFEDAADDNGVHLDDYVDEDDTMVGRCRLTSFSPRVESSWFQLVESAELSSP